PWMAGSVPTIRSRRAATAAPPNPPPTITIRVRCRMDSDLRGLRPDPHPLRCAAAARTERPRLWVSPLEAAPTRRRKEIVMNGKFLVASAVAAALALPLVSSAGPAEVPKFENEKCYGI